MAYAFGNDGFQIIQTFLSEIEIAAFRKALAQFGIAPGHRQLMQRVPEISRLAQSAKILSTLTTLLGTKPFAVRSIFFDKIPGANWLVPWHQDLSIATQRQIDLPGYAPWSIKDGVPHVQPPVEILESMATLRLHLDDCDESNGALRVIPGSHHFGRLDAAKISEIRSRQAEVTCSMRAGDVLVMRPLLLHASSEADNPYHRRVIHLEYAIRSLPAGLEWAEKPYLLELEPSPSVRAN